MGIMVTSLPALRPLLRRVKPKTRRFSLGMGLSPSRQSHSMATQRVSPVSSLQRTNSSQPLNPPRAHATDNPSEWPASATAMVRSRHSTDLELWGYDKGGYGKHETIAVYADMPEVQGQAYPIEHQSFRSSISQRLSQIWPTRTASW